MHRETHPNGRTPWTIRAKKSTTSSHSIPLIQGLRVMLGPVIAKWQPPRVAVRSPCQKVKKEHVLSQNTLLPVFNEWVEDSVSREQLTRIFFHPQPRPHFKREWKKYSGR